MMLPEIDDIITEEKERVLRRLYLTPTDFMTRGIVEYALDRLTVGICEMDHFDEMEEISARIISDIKTILPFKSGKYDRIFQIVYCLISDITDRIRDEIM